MQSHLYDICELFCGELFSGTYEVASVDFLGMSHFCGWFLLLLLIRCIYSECSHFIVIDMFEV